MKCIMPISALLFSASVASAACPVGNKIGQIDGKTACELKGDYTQDVLLDANHLWVLGGRVAIGGDNANSATLTIEAGTKIVGKSGPDYLLIRRGSKIIANGTASAPIVMTSSRANPSRGDWGGLVINGNAPVNGCQAQPCELQGEGLSGMYGGSNPADNSGVLRYVRVEYAGHLFNDEDELNGIAFQGVGNGTTVEYLQIHMANDDGVEFFGGTVNVKNVLVTGTKDDAFDWTFGWSGKAQFLALQMYADQGDNGIEADNNKKAKSSTPRSNPTLSNLTVVGSKTAKKGSMGVLFRHGTSVTMVNSIIALSKKACLDIDHDETFNNGITEIRGRKIYNLKMENTFVHCPESTQGAFVTVEKDKQGNIVSEPWKIADWFNAQPGNKIADPVLSRLSHVNPEDNNLVPAAGSPALSAGAPLNDSFFTPVKYIGAFGASDWTQGWTVR